MIQIMGKESPKRERKIMTRKASDNKYLHKDFHLSLNLMLDYVLNRFGKEAVVSYLVQYAKAYHRLLHNRLKAGDLTALSDYLTDIYSKEEWPVQLTSGDDFIKLKQDACPGVSHIRGSGGQPTLCYVETYRTVYETICEGTPYRYELKYYDDKTGACEQLFIKREEELQ
jgi:hypothetical protein